MVPIIVGVIVVGKVVGVGGAVGIFGIGLHTTVQYLTTRPEQPQAAVSVDVSPGMARHQESVNEASNTLSSDMIAEINRMVVQQQRNAEAMGEAIGEFRLTGNQVTVTVEQTNELIQFFQQRADAAEIDPQLVKDTINRLHALLTEIQKELSMALLTIAERNNELSQIIDNLRANNDHFTDDILVARRQIHRLLLLNEQAHERSHADLNDELTDVIIENEQQHATINELKLLIDQMRPSHNEREEMLAHSPDSVAVFLDSRTPNFFQKSPPSKGINNAIRNEQPGTTIIATKHY